MSFSEYDRRILREINKTLQEIRDGIMELVEQSEGTVTNRNAVLEEEEE